MLNAFRWNVHGDTTQVDTDKEKRNGLYIEYDADKLNTSRVGRTVCIPSSNPISLVSEQKLLNYTEDFSCDHTSKYEGPFRVM